MDVPFLQVSGPDGTRRVNLGDRPLTIGRHAQNGLVVNDNRASRFHCEVGSGADGYWVRDLKSSNGTLLNGRPVESSPIRPGDVVQIGAVRLTLVVPGAKPVRGQPHPAPDDGVDDLPLDFGAIEELGVGDALTDEDLAEPLTDMDIVETDEPVDSSTESTNAGEAADVGDYEKSLVELAESLPDKPFTDLDIILMGARGNIVHDAGKPARHKGPREAVEIFRFVLIVSSRGRGTDIHLEPKGSFYQVRMRVDGTMVDVVRLPNPMGVRLSALVKVLSDIDLSQKSSIQEGHFSSRLPVTPVPGKPSGGQRRVDYRVSFAPSVYGQKLVIRVLDTSYVPLHVRSLQLPPDLLPQVERAIRQDAGMVLVCGPTGSGKTTTLYALIRGSDLRRRNVVTIEDPVEIQIEAITQIPVDDSQGKSFSNLLRSLLRQDPDVIMIGEIRDAETAQIAMQAAITGHLVFSTVHTRDTVGTIFRLLDLGVEPYLISQGLQLVVAQRLARQLCKFCKIGVAPSADTMNVMGPAGKGVSRLFVPKGCPRCLGTGYAGRLAFFELLLTSDEIRELIMKTPTPGQIHAVLANTSFKSLKQSGYELVAQGLVAFDEIDRAMGRA